MSVIALAIALSTWSGPDAASLAIPPPEQSVVVVEYHSPVMQIWSQWGDLLADHFDEEDLQWAAATVWCESRGKESARNPAGSAAGLFQVLKSTAVWVLPKLGYSTRYETTRKGLRYNAEINVRIAAYLFYVGGGSKHWNESKSCWKKL
jgi:hypothetical protein